MAFVLDHFFVLTEAGAPQAERLSDIGLVEGAPNDHPGQGTANRRFFFSDAMLELLYVRDASEASNGPGRGLRFAERAAARNASPFGLIIRADPATGDPPFAGWPYYPDYLEGGRSFHIAENSDVLEEPLCVYVPFEIPAAPSQPQSAQKFTSVSEVRISVPVSEPSAVLDRIAQIDRVSLQLNAPHLIEVVFDEEREQRSNDLRPGLPLIIRW